MLLAVAELDIGSLWIADVLYAIEELKGWVGEKGELVAAVSLGYRDESPGAPARNPLDEMVRWLER
jgi:nitroreductase